MDPGDSIENLSKMVESMENLGPEGLKNEKVRKALWESGARIWKLAEATGKVLKDDEFKGAVDNVLKAYKKL